MAHIALCRWLWVVLATALLVQADGAAAGAGCDRLEAAGATPTGILAETRKDLPMTADANGYIAFLDDTDMTAWTFTKPGHEAHPSVVCRHLFKDASGWQVEMRVLCLGTDAVCRRLLATFTKLNEDMANDLKRHGS